MSLRLKAAAPPSDSDDDARDDDEIVEKRIKLIRDLSELERPPERFTGGIVVSSESESNAQSASASLSAAEKKGLKEVADLERELDLKNTFSKETNRRDEDAEMKKYIEEQIKIRREAAKRERERRSEENRDAHLKNGESELSEIFTLPAEATEKVDDILLHTLAKNFSSIADEKSEAMLSSQMLNGIPEVDLGLSERIRTIEATEEAKLRLAASGPSRNSSKKQAHVVPTNYSSNFQQHRSRDSNRDLSNASNGASKVTTEAVVSVGEEPREVECRQTVSGRDRVPGRGKASDDYYLQKFKKNIRR